MEEKESSRKRPNEMEPGGLRDRLEHKNTVRAGNTSHKKYGQLNMDYLEKNEFDFSPNTASEGEL